MTTRLDSYNLALWRALASLRAWLAAGAQARRERAMAIWGDGSAGDTFDARPDRTYRLLRTALRPRD